MIEIPPDLWIAIDRLDISLLQRRVISAVLYFTVSKPTVDIDAEDIRYYLGADKKLRTDRIQECMQELICRQILFCQENSSGKIEIGLQRDKSLWHDKMSHLLLQSNNNYINNIYYKVISGDKMSSRSKPLTSPQQILAYAHSGTKFKIGPTTWQIEHKAAKQLYLEAITLTSSPDDAFNLVCDYVDQNDWAKINVQKLLTYLASGLNAYASQIPPKPREIADNERALGQRYRYDIKLKRWIPAHVRQAPDTSARPA